MARRGHGHCFGGLTCAVMHMMAMVRLVGQGDVFQRETPGNMSQHTLPLAKGRGKAAGQLDVLQHANGTIDLWYSCDTFDEMIDYALNFSAPWGTSCGVDCALAGLMAWGGSGARS